MGGTGIPSRSDSMKRVFCVSVHRNSRWKSGLIMTSSAEYRLINSPTERESTLQVIFHSMESLANGLTNVTAFGLYSFAGCLLLPALFATPGYPRRLAWLGVVE